MAGTTAAAAVAALSEQIAATNGNLSGGNIHGKIWD